MTARARPRGGPRPFAEEFAAVGADWSRSSCAPEADVTGEIVATFGERHSRWSEPVS
jgi:hypothetical protein